jgi:hypothetical protein
MTAKHANVRHPGARTSRTVALVAVVLEQFVVVPHADAGSISSRPRAGSPLITRTEYIPVDDRPVGELT